MAVFFSNPGHAAKLADLTKTRTETAATAKELERVVEARARAAADAVRAAHKAELGEAHKARWEASDAVTEFLSANATHEWEGKKIVSVTTKVSRYGGYRSTEKTHGIVEVRRIGTPFPDNTASYNYPDMGEAFVRLLKQDGTPGAKFERLNRVRFGKSEWALDEEGADAS